MVTNILESLAYIVLFLVFIPFFFILYQKVLTPGIDLRDAFFEKDNVPAGIEFSIMFLAVSYLILNMITGPNTAPLMTDLWHVAVEILVVLLLFSIGRVIFGWFIESFNPYKEQEGVNLNNEIYVQKNYAATLSSLAWIIAIANGISFMDLFGEHLLSSLGTVAFIIIMNIIAMFWGYKYLMLHGGYAFKELFIDDNPAVGVSFLGFCIAFNIALSTACSEFGAGLTLEIAVETGGYLLLTLVTAGFAMLVVSGFFMKTVLKKSLFAEITEDNNVGAAFMQATILIGIMVVTSAITFGPNSAPEASTKASETTVKESTPPAKTLKEPKTEAVKNLKTETLKNVKTPPTGDGTVGSDKIPTPPKNNNPPTIETPKPEPAIESKPEPAIETKPDTPTNPPTETKPDPTPPKDPKPTDAPKNP